MAVVYPCSIRTKVKTSAWQADPRVIIQSAEALLSYRFRRGVRIFKDPQLLLRFQKVRLVSQPRAVFAVFYLDRKQRLIRFEELFHGGIDDVHTHVREIIRDALKWQAERLLCVRSDPTGNAQPTEWDIKDARELHRALDLIDLPLLDYIIAGESVTSLRQLRVFP